MPLQSPLPGVQEDSTQIPVAQVSVARGMSQMALHEPQSVSVLIGRSQPSAGLPLQSRKRPTQAVSAQTPVVHDSVAFASAQSTPHAPQFASAFSGVSQPFEGSPSQLP